MCLVAIAWRAHPRYPLIIAGNRDELHARPTTPAAWWPDAPQVLGGRDEVASGSWLAVSRRGRVAVVINDPRRPPGPARKASRGHLVRDFVSGDRPGGRFLDSVAVNEYRYAGFCLLLGTRVQVRGFVTDRGGSPHRWTLRPGIAVFSNSPLDTPSPKVSFLEAALREILAAEHLDREQVFAMLGRREPVMAVPAGEPPYGHLPFIAGETYGTRASTLVVFDDAGGCAFEERRFGPTGAPTGVSSEQFNLEA